MAQELQFDIRQIFIDACKYNDLYKVKLCCEGLGLSVNTKARCQEGGGRQPKTTGLIEALLEHSNEVVNWLLSQERIDVNLDSQIYTPLSAACYARNVRAVRRLVQAPGIDLNWQAGDGATAAHMAATNSAACVQVLASVPGVDWNKKDHGGETPLFYALSHGDPEAVRTILNTPGVDLQVRDELGNTVAHTCSRRWRSLELVQEGLFRTGRDARRLEVLTEEEEVPWNEKNNAGDTPLTMALKNNRPDMAKVLLKCQWVDATIADNRGRTPEMLARFVQLYSTVRKLFVEFDVQEQQPDLAAGVNTRDHGAQGQEAAGAGGEAREIQHQQRYSRVSGNIRNR